MRPQHLLVTYVLLAFPGVSLMQFQFSFSFVNIDLFERQRSRERNKRQRDRHLSATLLVHSLNIQGKIQELGASLSLLCKYGMLLLFQAHLEVIGTAGCGITTYGRCQHRRQQLYLQYHGLSLLDFRSLFFLGWLFVLASTGLRCPLQSSLLPGTAVDFISSVLQRAQCLPIRSHSAFLIYSVGFAIGCGVCFFPLPSRPASSNMNAATFRL